MPEALKNVGINLRQNDQSSSRATVAEKHHSLRR
jgi:hypothetical protein